MGQETPNCANREGQRRGKEVDVSDFPAVYRWEVLGLDVGVVGAELGQAFRGSVEGDYVDHTGTSPTVRTTGGCAVPTTHNMTFAPLLIASISSGVGSHALIIAGPAVVSMSRIAKLPHGPCSSGFQLSGRPR